MSVPCFRRNDYAAILQKIPTEGIVDMTVKYSVFEQGEPPSGWKYIGLMQKELSYYGRRGEPAPPPISILDLSEIKPDCSNIQSIHVQTTKHIYDIDSFKISIKGPTMPFTPEDIQEAGVKLYDNGFVYIWSSPPWNPLSE